MPKGTVTYKTKISGVLIKDFVVSPDNAYSDEIKLNTDAEGQLILELSVDGLYSGEEMHEELVHEIRRILGLIGYEFNATIGDIQFASSRLPKRNGNGIDTVIYPGAIMIDRLEEEIEPKNEMLQTMKSALESEETYKERFYPMYTFSNSQSDPVTRFMFLYNLVLSLCNDDQKNVDSTILSIEPNTPVSKSPRNNCDETIYTKLRNEVAHVRAGSSYGNSVTEIKSNVSNFVDIVRTLVGNQN